MEDMEFTYLRIYVYKEAPYRLPRYASDCLILMEFSKHLLSMHDKVWMKKATTTYQLPIVIGNYKCTTWCQVDMIRQVLALYECPTELGTDYYDPDGMIDAFFKKS